MKSANTKEVAITIRFPAEVAQSMKEIAEAEDRSFNSGVIRAVREYVARYRQGS